MPISSEKDLSKKSEGPLISNRKSAEEERPFLISNGERDEAILRYYDQDDVIKMRGLGYLVEPTVDENREIKSVDLMLSGSRVACEICEDMVPKDGGERVIKKATQRVEYVNGEVRMFCSDHFERKGSKSTAYTDWINDH